MVDRQHVFLIPGFFGFTSFGELSYFAHVRRALEGEAARAGLKVAIHDVAVPPTASIRARARALLAAVAKVGGTAAPIHLIGHSTGGLDARLLVSPGVSLGDGGEGVDPGELERVAARVRTVLTVATPHRGTPAATFFRTIFGRQLLRVLSLATIVVLSAGPLPVAALATLARITRRLDRELGLAGGLLHALEEQVLRDFTPVRRGELVAFLEQVGAESALVTQLAPEGIDLLNAGIGEREGVRYGSIVCCARRPGLGALLRVGPSPTALASHAVFAALHRIAGRAQGLTPDLFEPAQLAALRVGFGAVPRPSDNDGVVPTLSQPWGRVIAAVWADHLDILGHFDAERLVPPHHDWLSSGTRFGPRPFDEAWRRAFGFLAI
ncbi:MAG: triacylglycerol lipase [Deltaproteobacteria bacterium]|nr:triacylglycerol lipase [Deltaproteobacteria bacterium]